MAAPRPAAVDRRQSHGSTAPRETPLSAPPVDRSLSRPGGQLPTVWTGTPTKPLPSATTPTPGHTAVHNVDSSCSRYPRRRATPVSGHYKNPDRRSGSPDEQSSTDRHHRFFRHRTPPFFTHRRTENAAHPPPHFSRPRSPRKSWPVWPNYTWSVWPALDTRRGRSGAPSCVASAPKRV
jgi:hypothetical protein